MAKKEKVVADTSSLDLALKAIRKQFGNESILLASGRPKISKEDIIPTGIPSIDLALGIGGFARGRSVEIYGPEGSGKTTLYLQTIAEAQKLGLKGAIIDVEHALDLDYAEKLGVDTDNLLISQPDCAEEALSIVEELCRSREIGVVAVDSVAALVPQAEIEGEMGDSHMGLQARLMGQALRKITPIAGNSKTLIVWTNQIRMKIGILFGNPETTPGGGALKFGASFRIDLRKANAIKDGDEIIGNLTRVKIVKNKLAAPYKLVEVNLLHGIGFDRNQSLLDLLDKFELVQRAGTWYSIGDTRMGQGQAQAVLYVREHFNELKELLDKKVEEVGFKGESNGEAPADTDT